MTEQIRDMKLMDFGESRLKHYGLHTIKGRAIPSLMDGLKPVHRRILWAMYNKNLTPDRKALKAMVTIGETLGSYHPHGDMPVAEAMANMVTAPEPLIDGNGSNWGSVTDNPAAPRYTEARLSKFSYSNFFDTAYINTMDMEPNYDDRLLEPVTLPSKTFHIIINGTEGIAVGTKCNIPSFTLESVNKFVIKALSSKERIKPADGIKILKFNSSYGGHFVDTSENKDAFKALLDLGQATILFYPDYKIEDKKRLVITGVPMKLRNGKVLEKISEHPLVNCLIDETSIENGTRFVIDAKRGIIFDDTSIIPILKAFSSRQAYRMSYIVENVVHTDEKTIVESTLMSRGIIDALYDWISERKTSFVKATKWKIEQEQKKLDKLDLQLLAHTHRDILDACRDKSDPKAYLIQKLKVNDEGADYLLGMTVMQLTKINGDKIKEKIKEQKSTIAILEKQAKSPSENIVKEIQAI